MACVFAIKISIYIVWPQVSRTPQTKDLSIAHGPIERSLPQTVLVFYTFVGSWVISVSRLLGKWGQPGLVLCYNNLTLCNLPENFISWTSSSSLGRAGRSYQISSIGFWIIGFKVIFLESFRKNSSHSSHVSAPVNDGSAPILAPCDLKIMYHMQQKSKPSVKIGS